jgi:hypothetical protein
LAVSEGIRVGGGGCVLIEPLQGAKGNLERVKVLLVHHGVWKRANVKRSCLEKEKKIDLPYFLTGKPIGPSNRGSLWFAESLLKANFKLVGLSKGSFMKVVSA